MLLGGTIVIGARRKRNQELVGAGIISGELFIAIGSSAA